MWNSLAQVLLKITAPGVPDFYQGTETWDFSLVDPDNRRPVEYDTRRTLLARIPAALDAATFGDLVRHRIDGRLKLLVTTRALRLRHDRRALFARGDYVALDVRGARAAHAFAFLRAQGGEAALTVVPRLTTALVGSPTDVPVGESAWADTEIAVPAEYRTSRWRDALTGRIVRATPGGALRLAEVCAALPAALLAAEPGRR